MLRPRVRRRHGAELSKACDSHEAKGLGGVLPKDKKDRPAFCVAIGMCATTTTRPDVRTCHARPAMPLGHGCRGTAPVQCSAAADPAWAQSQRPRIVLI